MFCLRLMTSAVALAAVVAVTVPSAHAQAKPTAKLNEASKQRARKAMYAGRAKMESGDHEGALAEFRTADEIVAVPSTRLAVAQALEALGRLTEAQQIAASVALMPKRPREPKALVKAREQAAELATQLDARIPKLTVVLADLPAGAAVTATLDGAPTEIDALAAGVALDPGTHQLQVRVGEQPPETREVVLEPSQRKTVKLSLTVSDQVPVEEASGGAISPLLWAGVGVAGAGLVLGGVMGGLALSKNADLDAACTLGDGNDCPADLRDERDEAVMFSHVSTAGFALAGAGAVLGVVGLVMSAGGDSDEARVVPLIGPGMVGVGGRF